MANKKKEVAVKDETAVAAWGAYSGADGFEDIDRSEIAIPFINLLQSNSEQVEDGNASAGQFYNNVMQTFHDDMRIVPCARQRVFVEWVPVEDGGGLIAVHDPSSEFVQAALQSNGGSPIGLKVSDGKHDLVETIYLYVLVLEDENTWSQAVISFSSSKLKRYKQFFTKATQQTLKVGDRKIRLPLWAHVWKLTSEAEVSKQGKKFKNLSLSFDGDNAADCRIDPEGELCGAASDFYEMVVGGMARADLSQAQSDKDEADEEVPF